MEPLDKIVVDKNLQIAQLKAKLTFLRQQLQRAQDSAAQSLAMQANKTTKIYEMHQYDTVYRYK